MGPFQFLTGDGCLVGTFHLQQLDQTQPNLGIGLRLYRLEDLEPQV
jgi:hypothetical protein